MNDNELIKIISDSYETFRSKLSEKDYSKIANVKFDINTSVTKLVGIDAGLAGKFAGEIINNLASKNLINENNLEKIKFLFGEFYMNGKSVDLGELKKILGVD